MLRMERVGVRELGQRASGVLRRVVAGETIEVTNRGRSVAILVRSSVDGASRLERGGVLLPAVGDLLDIAPVPLPKGAQPPSEVVSAGRDE